ncbi:MAG: hypothetical protein IT373_30005 [Polyangiaceae bacterium]|nr:hypothetical protein [Polyangiaceae bacterium]
MALSRSPYVPSLGRLARLGPVAVCAFGAAACPGAGPSAPTPPVLTASAPPASAESSAAPAPKPECTPEVVQAFAAKPTMAAFCAARAACPSFTGWVEPRSADATPRRARSDWTATLNGHWALLTTSLDARVFALGPDGFTLRYLLDWGTARLLGDRLWIEHDGDATLLELATGATKHLGAARVLGVTASDLLVAGTERSVRLRRADLAERDSVSWVPDSFNAEQVVVLRGGASVLLGGALVSFPRGQVVRQKLNSYKPPAGAVRPDGERLVMCDGDGALVEVDTESGATTATFRRAKVDCTPDRSGTGAAYTADPRYVFWGEPESAQGDGGGTVIAVGDTLQGTVAEYVDGTVPWEGIVAPTARLDAASGRLCLDIQYSSHTGGEICNWELAAGGRPVRSRGPAARPPGLAKGASVVVDATSPSGARRAVLTQRRQGNTLLDLSLTAYTQGHVDRTILVQDHPPWASVQGPEYGSMVRPVALVFFDEHHVAVLPDGNTVPPGTYVDIDTGEVTPLFGGGELAGLCSLAGDGEQLYDDWLRQTPLASPRWVTNSYASSIFDGFTGRTYEVKPTEGEWDRATHFVPTCP